MKRDKAIVRAILEEFEKAEPKQTEKDGSTDLDISAIREQVLKSTSANPVQYRYIMGIMKEAGFFRDDNFSKGLSWLGCDYLDELRSSSANT